MKRDWILAAVFIASLLIPVAGCDQPTQPTADQKDQYNQEKMQEEAQAQTGMPGITNYTEKKVVRKLYELRDQNIATHAYVMDMNGRLFHVCESIGYGLPYGVQYSNPEKHLGYDGAQTQGYELPQSEPNGLYMPPTAEGTWVICADQQHKGEIAPIYIEPRVIVSPFPLNAAGEWQK